MKYKIESINNYNDELFQKLYNKIRKEKKDEIDKYITKESKERSILGEKLLMDLLGENDYKLLRIERNKNGKPYIKNKKTYYNISHSNNYVTAVVSNNQIGIDIEKVRKISLKVIDKFASKNEKQYIYSKENGVEKRLFEIYTLKEAYIKMKGLALKNIKTVEFKIEKEKITCSDQKTKSILIYDIPDYIVAICEKSI